ncbi:PAS domain-containing protein [Mucilaginibacter galii]|uniref:PAS domain-containing protein n=2 Tax=Mucilaginibacter galii TaxID=2005073 RepID=UPI00166EF3C2|nr:PAS domain-containing protein [Mucilaginibacter galii]
MQDFYPMISSPKTDFEAFYNQAPCGLFTFRADGTIVHLNKTLLTWLCADAEDVIYHDFTDFLDKGGKLYYQLFVQPLLRMRHDVKEISFHMYTAKCDFHCLFSATAFEKDGDGELLYAATVYKVTDRKKYEDELLKKKQQADIEKEIKEDTLKQVAYDQSHLVRAPLANILGLTALLEGMEVSDEVRDMIDLLRTSAVKLDSEVIKLTDKLTA